MKKLAYATAGNFEMPKLEMVGLEKESNMMLASGLTVWKPNGSTSGFSQEQILRALTQSEEEALGDIVSA